MPVFLARWNDNAVTGLEYADTVVELDLERTLENLADMTDRTPVRAHFQGVLDQPQLDVTFNDHLLAHTGSGRFPIDFVEIDLVLAHLELISGLTAVVTGEAGPLIGLQAESGAPHG